MLDRAVLLLRLEGPLQSWGERARWDIRDTADRPTKSGVMGMVGCALGYPRNDPRLALLQDGVTFGVRVDRAGSRMVDYHTVRGEIPSADGKRKGTPEEPYTIVSRRAYLQDASFLVGLEGPRALLEVCENGLRRPRWPYYLGRRSCPPSCSVLVGLLDGVSLRDALRATCPGGVADPAVGMFLETPGGEVSVRDRSLGRPAREYVLTRYQQVLAEGSERVPD